MNRVYKVIYNRARNLYQVVSEITHSRGKARTVTARQRHERLTTSILIALLAMGTSLPELVTSIVAARKGQNDIAMGNVIGSNLFNIFLILGVSSVITPIPVQATSIVDCLFLIAISAVFYLPARKGKLGRVPGIAMVAMYAVYTVYLIMR